MTTDEGNEMIALFDGAIILEPYFRLESGVKTFDHNLLDMGKERKTNERYVAVTCLKYHSSWDWLMPVVEKIRNIDCNVGERGEYQTSPELILAIDKLANYSILYVGIIDVWLTVTNFIKWYNNEFQPVSKAP